MGWDKQFLSMNYSIKYFDNIKGLTWASEAPSYGWGCFVLQIASVWWGYSSSSLDFFINKYVIFLCLYMTNCQLLVTLSTNVVSMNY